MIDPVRRKILVRQYIRLYGGGNPNFSRFARAVTRGGRHLDMPRYYSGRDRGKLAACYLVTAGGDLVAVIAPGGEVAIRGEDFR